MEDIKKSAERLVEDIKKSDEQQELTGRDLDQVVGGATMTEYFLTVAFGVLTLIKSA